MRVRVELKRPGKREEDTQSQYRAPEHVVQCGRQMWLAAMPVVAVV